ncbi:unnamed protein product [Paramecium sonneborni]|uniref:Uncharacterized protein n=1 Tax=Paramecium sonneborni TaxID=65129 RepID=A0A8S1NWU3_9CILI|nr:unnamed protein product [Paramecium sonneborni]
MSNKKGIYNFQLKVDNAQELLNSVLFWKYLNETETKIIKNNNLQDDIAHFQIEVKNQKIIEYWYQNSQNIQEKVHRKLSQQTNLVDKFDCLNLVVNCKTQKEHIQLNQILYYQYGSKQRIINFNEQQLIHLDSKSEQIKFILEIQDSDFQIKEVTFQIDLHQLKHPKNSLYYLEILETDLEQLNYSYQNFKSKNGQFEFKNLTQKKNKLEDIIFLKYSQFQQDWNQREELCQTFQTVTQNLESILKPMKTYPDQFTQLNNFFKEKQFTEYDKQSEICDSFQKEDQKKISQTFQYEIKHRTFERENSLRIQNQDEEAKQNRKIKDQMIIKANKLMQEYQTKQKESSVDKCDNVQSSILQPKIIEKNQSQQDLQKQNQEMIDFEIHQDKIIKDYQSNIESLQVVIHNLKIQNVKLKEENQEMKKNLQSFQNFRRSRFIDPTRNVNSICNNNFVLNPVIEAAKQIIQPDLEQCQKFKQSIEKMTFNQMISKNQDLYSQRTATQWRRNS